MDLQRGVLALAMAAILTPHVAPALAASASEIDQKATAALKKLYATTSEAKTLGDKAKGSLKQFSSPPGAGGPSPGFRPVRARRRVPAASSRGALARGGGWRAAGWRRRVDGGGHGIGWRMQPVEKAVEFPILPSSGGPTSRGPTSRRLTSQMQKISRLARSIQLVLTKAQNFQLV